LSSSSSLISWYISRPSKPLAEPAEETEEIPEEEIIEEEIPEMPKMPISASTAIPIAAPTITSTPSPTIEYKYKFFQGLDPGPYDFGTQKRNLIDKVDDLKKVCNETPECLGFNTNGWIKWKIPPKTEWNFWTEQPNQGMYIKENVEILPDQKEWQCLPGLKVPLNINEKGDVQCMALDRASCLFSTTMNQCNNIIKEYENKKSIVKPLVCGTMHKNQYGTTGYDNPKHWCSKGKLLIDLK